MLFFQCVSHLSHGARCWETDNELVRHCCCRCFCCCGRQPWRPFCTTSSIRWCLCLRCRTLEKSTWIPIIKGFAFGAAWYFSFYVKMSYSCPINCLRKIFNGELNPKPLFSTKNHYIWVFSSAIDWFRSQSWHFSVNTFKSTLYISFYLEVVDIFGGKKTSSTSPRTLSTLLLHFWKSCSGWSYAQFQGV